MQKRAVLITVMTIALTACAPMQNMAGAKFVAARKLADDPAPGAAAAQDPPPVMVAARPVRIEKFVPVAEEPARRPAKAIASANKTAVQKPSSDKFINAITVYDYLPGSLYQLYCSPVHITDIMLAPGEALTSAAAGDTIRWMVADTTSGAGATRRVHIYVKPVKAGLTTNLVVATDRHIYHLEAKSYNHTYQAAVEWNYPREAFTMLKRKQAQAREHNQQMIAGVNPQALNFDYRVTGDAPFKPVRVFDDGQKTYIEFPEIIKSAELPPLFIISGEDKPQIVNYRYKNRFYVVDRLFKTAMLAIGEKDQQKVFIYNRKLMAQTHSTGDVSEP